MPRKAKVAEPPPIPSNLNKANPRCKCGAEDSGITGCEPRCDLRITQRKREECFACESGFHRRLNPPRVHLEPSHATAP